MSEANTIFNYEGREVSIQCSKNEKMKDICQRYSNKINININSLIFLYGGNQLNFNLNFNEQVIDKEKNEMKVFVYKNENNEYICPKCGEKIKLNTEKIDDIILSINNIKDTINGTKSLIENIIRISSNNSMNNQLKSVNLVLNTLNEDIKKLNEKFNNLLNNNEIKNINNYIIAEIIIKDEDINKDIRILNSYEESLRINKYIEKNKDLNNEDEIKKCEIKINEKLIPFNYIHKFEKSGKYTIKYSFKNNLTNTAFIFRDCSSLNNINLSNFNTNNVTDMSWMFSDCSSLNSLDLSNFNINNIKDINEIFFKCINLSSLNLSNFHINNFINMDNIFYGLNKKCRIEVNDKKIINEFKKSKRGKLI